MIRWGDQSVPACESCNSALEALRHRERTCAFGQFTMVDLRPTSTTEAAKVIGVVDPTEGATRGRRQGWLKWLLGG